MNRAKEKIFNKSIKNSIIKSIDSCFINGERLFEEANSLFEFENSPTAFALSILAQEEFAKAFILYLVKEEIIPWNAEIRRSLNDHSCKQLLGLIMDYFSSSSGDVNDWRMELENRIKEPYFPQHVADAMNIYRYEKIKRWKSNNWVWAYESNYNKTANKIAEGKFDKKKQDSFYVRIGKNGQIVNTPLKIKKEDIEESLEKTKNFLCIISQLRKNDTNGLIKFGEFKELMKILFSQ